MPSWHYEEIKRRDTPDPYGIDSETESRYEKEGRRLIVRISKKMGINYNTMMTGVLYFCRFYMVYSFKTFPRYVMACSCLHLASKVEGTPKKCKDIIRTAKTLLSEQEFMTFGEDPKKEVLDLEKGLRKTIEFDLQVKHPYSYLLKYVGCLKGDRDKMKEMVQLALALVANSSCITTMSLQWKPEIIAVALIHWAGKMSGFEVVDWFGRQPEHLQWWDMFVEDLTMDRLDDICGQVIDLYFKPANNTEPSDSPPMVSSSEVCRERSVTAATIESASNTTNANNPISSLLAAPPRSYHPPQS